MYNTVNTFLLGWLGGMYNTITSLFLDVGGMYNTVNLSSWVCGRDVQHC